MAPTVGSSACATGGCGDPAVAVVVAETAAVVVEAAEAVVLATAAAAVLLLRDVVSLRPVGGTVRDGGLGLGRRLRAQT